MRRPAVILSVVVCVFVTALRVDAAEPKFARPPAATREGRGVRITFAVDRATDVEVAVLNARGDVVRHLAAGLLGVNPPAPLRKNSLEQQVIWDRRDDNGRPVGGAVTVRVRLGLGAKLDRFVPSAGAKVHVPVTALGVGENGEVYVLSNRGHASAYLYVLDRGGKYLRTLLPSPANLKNEQLKGLERLKLRDGSEVPVVYQGNAAHLAPFLSGIRRQQLAVTKQGVILFVSGGNDYSDQSVPRHVLAVKTDGSTPEDVGFVGPRLGGHGRYSIGLPTQQLAASPDGKTLYFVGVGSTKTRRRPAKGIHAVARLTLTSKAPQPFIGEPDKPGGDPKHLNSPVSLTTDPKGNIYVADAGNNRVAVFDPDGKPLGETRVERPWQVCVDPNTGALFVLQKQQGRRWGAFALMKFDKAIGGKEVARLALHGRYPVFALDAGARPPKVWLAYNAGWGRAPVFISVLDRGGKLEKGPSVLKGTGAHLNSPLFVSVDPVRERLYVGDFSRVIRLVDLKTGNMRKFLTASEVALDAKGNVYALSGYGTNTLLRFTPQGRPLPFKATGSNKLAIKYRAGLPHVGVRGLTIAPSGDLYVYQDNNNRPMHLWVFDRDGNVKSKDLIHNIPGDSACSVAVDRSGNVYAGVNVNNPKRLYNDAFTGVVPARGWINIYSRRATWFALPQRGWPKAPPWNRMYLNFYINHYGYVFKFSPRGGRFWIGGRPKAGANPRPAGVPGDAVEYRDAYLRNVVWCQGVVWRYHGFALCTNRTESYGDPGCSCWTGRFAMDKHERLFVPDVFRFSVGVLDKNGNEIVRFGKYGNVDSAGPGSAIPEPDIPVAWCNAVAVGGGRAYIADRINRRVAVVRLTYAAEQVCEVE